MTTAQSRAYRFRCLILIVGILFTLCGLTWCILPFFNNFLKEYFDMELGFMGLLGTPLIYHPIAGDDEFLYGINLFLVVGLLLLLQWAFLRPSKGWTIQLATEGRPLKSSIIAAGVMSMLLTTGLIALLLELPNWWEPIMDTESHLKAILPWCVMLVIWGGWTWIFFTYWKQGDRYTQLGKMIRGLVVGSILEIVVAVPVHVWAVRQRECYCCRGTYTTLILAGTVLIWVFGPGIILLYMREKYRRMKLMPTCPQCGYDLKELSGSGETGQCPECRGDVPGDIRENL